MRPAALPLLPTLLLLPALLLPLLLPAQKREREFEIRGDEVPAAVVAYVDSAFAEAGRVRYYQDVSEDGTAVEAKFRLGDTRYSVEFDYGGDWRDTEWEVPVDEVPNVVWDAEACPRWTDSFELYRVVRVQDHVDREGARFYEVELRARRDREWLGYQYQISPDGVVLTAKEIALSPGHLARW